MGLQLLAVDLLSAPVEEQWVVAIGLVMSLEESLSCLSCCFCGGSCVFFPPGKLYVSLLPTFKHCGETMSLTGTAAEPADYGWAAITGEDGCDYQEDQSHDCQGAPERYAHRVYFVKIIDQRIQRVSSMNFV